MRGGGVGENAARALKRELRQTLRDRLAGVSAADARTAGDRAMRHLRGHAWWREAKVVLLYAPVRGEIDVLSLAAPAWGEGKRVLLPHPVEAERRLSPVEWVAGTALVSGPYGIPVPTGAEAGLRTDLALIPGLGFDLRGGRLGSGLGYYDRWLLDHPETRRVGACHAFQLVESVPSEPHDVPMHAVLTPEGLRAVHLDTKRRFQ